MDEDNNKVKIKSITKEEYNGKIYDVDVSNDIILVKKQGKALWSGNSNGQILDSSSFANHGTCIPGTSCPFQVKDRSGISNQAYLFDGSDVINVQDNPSLDITKNSTILAWVNFSQVKPGPIITKWNDSGNLVRSYTFSIDWRSGSQDEFYLAVDADGNAGGGYFVFSTNANLQPNTWYHLAAVYDAVTVLNCTKMEFN